MDSKTKLVTYDMLPESSRLVRSLFKFLYPSGLTMEQLEEKAKRINFLRIVHEHVKES